jgi:hypothetical protein
MRGALLEFGLQAVSIPYLESFQFRHTAQGSELAPARSTDKRFRLFETLHTSTRLASHRDTRLTNG